MRLFPACIAVAAAILSGCAGPRIAPAAPVDGVVSGRCHTDMVRGAVGLAASDATIERARIDSDSQQVRVVRGAAQRRSPEPPPASTGGARLTVETGANNAITDMHCG